MWDPPLLDLTKVLSRRVDGLAAGQGTKGLNQVPDMLIRFHLCESGHAAQPDSILRDPGQFSIQNCSTRFEIRFAALGPISTRTWKTE